MPSLKPSPPSRRRTIPIVAQAAGADGTVPLFEAHRTVHARSVSGRFAHWRRVMVWLTQLVFYGLPWLLWGQRQAVLFDLGARRFYLFGLVLYPQDFIYLAGLLVVSALSLFLFTAVAGRLWCGFACPQTVYTEIFLWIERQAEGERAARIRLDAAPMSMEKLVRKSFKHIVWLMVAMWTGFSFVGYFTPVRELGMEFLQTRMGSWEVFWVFFYGLATYGNAGFLREQVCKYMCPYARFQSAMFDQDTLVVTYDAARGEPRGSRARHADAAALGQGACVDCTLCVQVCPTGIDIRRGLQCECIGCGLCADACNAVMDKIGDARGLIRYATLQALQQGWPGARIWRRVLRPRVLVYAAVLAVVAGGLLASLAWRTPFRVDVVRDRGAMARTVQGGRIENVYRLQLMNATESLQRYRIAADGLPGISVDSDAEFTVPPAASRWVAVRLRVPPADAGPSVPPGSHPIVFSIDALDAPGRVVEKSVFLVPR